MIVIKSYIKKGKEFIPLCSFSGEVDDPLYIEGAIELRVGNKDLFTKEMWDLVHQLWSYPINGLRIIASGDEFVTYFPDQPIKVVLRPDQSRRTVAIQVDCNGLVEARADYNEFFTAVTQGAREFFEKMIEQMPKQRTFFEPDIRAIDELEKSRGSRIV
jgi:hypothetical protein